MRDAVTIVEKMDIDKMQGKDMDALIDFMVKVYDKQFTRDDVYDGLYADELMTSLMDTVQTVVNGTAKRLEPKKRLSSGNDQKLSLREWIDELYINLMKHQYWKLNEIDEMDFLVLFGIVNI